MRRLLSVVLAATCAFLASERDASAISWGEPDFQHTYVVMVATQVPGSEEPLFEVCSGVLLSPFHVLTAAHCVDGYEENTITAVFAGPTPLQPPANLVSLALLPVDGSHMHPDFVDIGIGPDLAVLNLVLPVVDYGLADLPESPDYLDTIARGASGDRIINVIGYGTEGVSALNSEDPDPIFTRQVGDQILLSINDGVGEGDYVQLSSNAGISGGPCFGDSGGPNIPQGTNTVVAINSSGFENCAGMSLSSRVDTSTALDFIRTRLGY